MTHHAIHARRAQIAFLIDSNALALTTALGVCIFMTLAAATCLAALLGQPKWGFITIALVILTVFACLLTFARWWRECILRLHGDVASLVVEGAAGRPSYVDVGGKAMPRKAKGADMHEVEDGFEEESVMPDGEY